jgi:hypothetical protein
MLRAGRLGEVALKRGDRRSGRQKIVAQRGGHRRQVVILDRLPAIRQERRTGGHAAFFRIRL